MNTKLLHTSRKLSTYFSNPAMLIGWISLIVFGYLILGPVGEMIISSFQVQTGEAARVGADAAGEGTLYYWNRMFAPGRASQQLLYEPLMNTLVVSGSFTLIAMAIGIFLAWIMVKTDIAYKRFISFVAILPYIMPSWTLALAWTTVFGSTEVGVGHMGFYQGVFSVAPPEWLSYGPVPMIVVLAINYFAYSYILVSAALVGVDASLEEAAILHGVRGTKLLRTVTLPIILPAVGSAFILTFADGLGTFGVPSLLGIPVGYRVLATSLYRAANIGRFGDVFVLTIVLIVVSGLAILVNSRILGRRRQFTTVGGKGVSTRVVSLGQLRKPLGLVVALIFGAFAAVPVFFLVMQSVQSSLGSFSFSDLTLRYWIGEGREGFRGILVEPRVLSAARNTMSLGVIVGIGTAFIGMLIGYAVTKLRPRPISRMLEVVSFIPFVIPGIAFGSIYLTMFAQPRGPIPALYGTFFILILAAMVNRLPFAGRMGISSMMQVGPSLEESAELHGARFGRRLRRILLPLTKRGFVGGFILTFVSTVKDLNLVILLVTPRTMLLAPLTIGYLELGQRQFADAIGVVLVLMVIVSTVIAQKLTGTNPIRNAV
ncbi:MAG: iron ABC transporter permease [Spirochaeta sp.]|nr:iron ABC transporter permease [Spirochaeta sp.]